MCLWPGLASSPARLRRTAPLHGLMSPPTKKSAARPRLAHSHGLSILLLVDLGEQCRHSRLAVLALFLALCLQPAHLLLVRAVALRIVPRLLGPSHGSFSALVQAIHS